jgi:hypothetical protein
MRKHCMDCTRKHLAQALVISHELAWYDDHLWVCVGHLAEAEAQSQKKSQYLADKIREQRLLLMKEGVTAAAKLDIDMLINMASELASEESSQPVFGVDIPDTEEENPNG